MDNHAYILCGLLGVLVQLLITYQSLSKTAKNANTSLSFGQFLKNDWVGMVLAILPVIMWLLTFAEAANKYPILRDYIRISFILVGMVGAYGLQKIFGRSKEIIREVIDKKTNIADAVTGTGQNNENG